MKTLYFLALLCISGLSSAQYLIEDNDVTENVNELGRSEISFDLNQPLEFYRLKCSQATYAQFPGGENAFKEELYKTMSSTVASRHYSVNGTFEFVLNLSQDGKLKNFQLKPEVENSELLYQDLNFMFLRMQKKWIPATCDNLPVESKLRLRVNFRTDNYDI